MSSVREGFGKAKEGSGIEILKVGMDETKGFRIFPPKGKLASKGIWAIYHQQHYGYGVRDPKDPSKVRPRPFLCVEEKDGEITKVSCPECRKIEETKRLRKEQFDAEVKRLMDEKVPQAVAEAQATKLVESYDEFLQSHNLDRKWYMVALAEDGRIGYLVIPHKAKKAMDTEKKKLLTDEKIDLLDIDNGAWVEVTRTGKGRNTEYTSRIAQEHTTVNGQRAKVTKVSGLTDAQLQQAFDLPDLDSGSIIRKLSRDQVRMLAEGSGVPEEVEAILNLGQVNTRKEESPAPAPVRAPEAPRAAPTPAQVKVQAAPAVPPVDPQAAAIAALQAQLAALMAPKAATPAAAPAAPQAPVEDVKSMSDDDFMAKFGPKA